MKGYCCPHTATKFFNLRTISAYAPKKKKKQKKKSFQTNCQNLEHSSHAAPTNDTKINVGEFNAKFA